MSKVITLSDLLKTTPSTITANNFDFPEIGSGFQANQINTYLKSDQNNYFPNWLGAQSKKLSNFNNAYTYFKTINQLSSQQKKALATKNPTILGWDQDNNKWTGAFGRQANGVIKRSTQQYRARIAQKTNTLISTTMTQAQINQSLPGIVKQILRDNDVFSKFGVGPVNGHKFPLYTGRWVDSITGQLKMLPKASAKYLNPASYNQRKSYLQARVLNKWNQFVKTVQQYANLSQKDAVKWQKNKISSIANKFQKQKQTIGLPNKIINQYKKYVLGLPMGNGGKLFWANVDSGLIIQLKGKIDDAVKSFALKQNNQQNNLSKKTNAAALITFAQKMLNSVIAKITKMAPGQQAAVLSYGYSFANSKLISIRNNLLQISKVMNIPSNLSQLNVQTYQKQMQQDKKSILELIKKNKNLNYGDFADFKIGSGQLKDLLGKATQQKRIYYTGNVPDFKKPKQVPNWWGGYSFGGYQSGNYQSGGLVGNKFLPVKPSPSGVNAGNKPSTMVLIEGATVNDNLPVKLKTLLGAASIGTPATKKRIKNALDKLPQESIQKVLQLAIDSNQTTIDNKLKQLQKYSATQRTSIIQMPLNAV